MLTLLIVDDHEVVRKGLKFMLLEAEQSLSISEAENGEEALGKLQERNFDVVLLDVSMPGRSGIEVLKDIKNARPKLPVVMLSMYPEEQYAIRAIKAGASGYLTKNTACKDLVLAVRAVSAGRKYITFSLAEKLTFEFGQDLGKLPHERLSDREYEVMSLLGSGKTVSEIARKLSLSPKTISTHRTRILEKMRMKNSAEVMYYAIKNDLVQ